MPIDPRDRRRTPVGGVPRAITEAETSSAYASPLDELTTRARSATRGIDTTNRRLDALEQAIGQLAAAGAMTEAKVQEIDTRSKASDDKLDRLVEAAEEERETREARADTARLERIEARKRADERADRQAERKSTDRKATLSAVGALVAAVFTGIAMVFAATHGTAPAVAAAPIYAPAPAPAADR